MFQFPRETKGKSITRKVPGGKEKKKKQSKKKVSQHIDGTIALPGF